MLISKIKPNPDNPRYINADDFNRLVVSILIFPEMLRARGLVIKNKIVVGGNARLQAIRHIIKMNASTRADLILVNTAGTDLDYGSLSSFWNEIATTQQIPDEWVVDAGTWTEDQIRQFIIKDNTHFGAWDKEAIANAWNSDEIRDWGVDVGGMSNIVFNMLDNGWTDAGICNELGMEPEELLKLKHLTGFSKLFKDVEYKRAWESRNQIKIRMEFEKSETKS